MRPSTVHRQLLVLALLLTACSSGADYGAALYRWQDAQPRAYVFDYYEGGMGVPRAARVTVRDGGVSSVAPVPGVRSPLPGAAAPTVDDVIEQLRDDLRHADRVTVSYDRTWGFPSHVAVDEMETAVDDEHGYDIEQFRVLSDSPPPAHLQLAEAHLGCDATDRPAVALDVEGTGQGEVAVLDARGHLLTDRSPVSAGRITLTLTSTADQGVLRLTAAGRVLQDYPLVLRDRSVRCG